MYLSLNSIKMSRTFCTSLKYPENVVDSLPAAPGLEELPLPGQLCEVVVPLLLLPGHLQPGGQAGVPAGLPGGVEGGGHLLLLRLPAGDCLPQVGAGVGVQGGGQLQGQAVGGGQGGVLQVLQPLLQQVAGVHALPGHPLSLQ